MAITFTGNTAPGPNLQVGITSNGALTINGGYGYYAATLDTGVNAGATGTVTVQGGGSYLELVNTYQPEAIIGDAGGGVLNVLSGGPARRVGTGGHRSPRASQHALSRPNQHA